MKANLVLALLLLVGVVDKIEDDVALVEYEKNGGLQYSYVSLSQSACLPTEGQKVYFFEGYKIVTCEDPE